MVGAYPVGYSSSSSSSSSRVSVLGIVVLGFKVTDTCHSRRDLLA